MKKKPWEIWNEISEQETKVGIAQLTAVERTISLVNSFCFELECGGLTGFLYNASPTSDGESYWGNGWAEVEATAHAIEAVGDAVSAGRLREILQLVAKADTSAPTWGEFLNRADPEHRCNSIQPELYAQVEDLYKKLEAFTAVHYDCHRD